MNQRRVATLILIAAAAALAGSAVFRGLSTREKPLALTPAASSGTQPAGAASHNADATGSPKAISAPPVSAADVYTKYRQSPNFAAFIADAKPAARAGDGKAARLIAASYAECAGLGKDSSEYIAFMMGTVGKSLRDDASRDAFKSALTAEAARCSELNAEKQPTSVVQYWNDMAAKDGDLTSKVSLLMPLNNNHVTADDVQGLIAQAVANKDSDAIARLGGAMSMAGGSQSIYGKYSGQETSAYVWQLASCSFGANCSNTGPLLTGMCLTAGRCSYATLDDAFKEIFSPLQYERIVQQQNFLVSSLQQGNVSAIYQQ